MRQSGRGVSPRICLIKRMNGESNRMAAIRNAVRMLIGVCLSVLFAAFLCAQKASKPLPVFPKIKCEELKKMIDDKAAGIAIVSNDPQGSYDEGHIPGAISYPWDETLQLPIPLPRDKTLILYCSCAREEDSLDMAAKLAKVGYRNIKILGGGLLRWQELKYPIETFDKSDR